MKPGDRQGKGAGGKAFVSQATHLLATMTAV
jgi:hypothetical protein